MKQVDLEDSTYDRLLVASRLMDQTVGEVIAQLVDRLAGDGAASPLPDPPRGAGDNHSSPRYTPPTRVAVKPEAEWIPVFKVYKGHRLDGAFNPRTHEVQLSTMPWVGRVFPSPTAAAVAAVDHFSGDARESPNTNGRKFWKVADSGENLHSIIGER